jgi:nicotinate-nucleotide adenylyltransferase
VRIGVLGGTFDPIHVGHLAAARAALECESLDKVLFIPTGVPPHRGRAVADGRDRLEMCRLAIAGERRFEVSDLEVRRGGTSYTVDTLRALRGLHPDDTMVLILGWDAAKLFGTWREPGEIRRLASLIVVTRPGSGPLTAASLEAAGLGPGDSVCERETPDISGSELREEIARGEPVGDCLPPAVERYIAEHGLYADNQQVGC